MRYKHIGVFNPAKLHNRVFYAVNIAGPGNNIAAQRTETVTMLYISQFGVIINCFLENAGKYN